jgi:putative addiction module antidote
MRIIPSILAKGAPFVFVAKVRKVGNSLAVILTRHTIETLGISASDEMTITQVRGRLSMRKLSPASRPFAIAGNRLIRKYRRVLSRLYD